MKAIVLQVAFTLLLTTVSSCRHSMLSGEEMAAYVADTAHGLKQIQQVGDVEVSVTYQPVDLLITRELMGLPLRQAAVDSLRKKYHNTTFFLLSVSRNQRELLQPKEGFTAYSDLLQTLSFQMNEHVRLLTSQGDTIKPSNYYLDRTYGSANATQLLFAFPKISSAGIWQFQMQECGLGTGNLRFAFDASLPDSVPTLALAD